MTMDLNLDQVKNIPFIDNKAICEIETPVKA